MGKQNISKDELYSGVKAIIDADSPFVHLYQHKLFTLFSIGFQYFLFNSTKNPGHYIIRIEDGRLAEKLSYKAKDDITRKFMQKLIIARKMKYGQSTFYLDYFHIGSWSLVSDLPRAQVKGALIVKNTVINPLQESVGLEAADGRELAASELPKDYFFTSLKEFVPQIVTIGFESEFGEEVKRVTIPFIKENEERVAKGVKLAKDLLIDLDD